MHTASQMSSLTCKARSPGLLPPRSRGILGVGGFPTVLGLPITIELVLAGAHLLRVLGGIGGIAIAVTNHRGAGLDLCAHFGMYPESGEFTNAAKSVLILQSRVSKGLLSAPPSLRSQGHAGVGTMRAHLRFPREDSRLCANPTGL